MSESSGRASQSAHLVVGPGVNVCSDCVELIIVIMKEDGYQPPAR
ncbi:hypothetical protein [Kitasatospora sp. NPDC089509]